MAAPALENPLREPEGPRAAAIRKPEPCTVVLFGATGDLAHRKVVPALYSLAADGLASEQMAIVGVGRRQLNEEEFRRDMRASVDAHARLGPTTGAAWGRFESRLFYHAGPLNDPATFDALRQRLRAIDEQHGTQGNRLYYLATPPGLFLPLTRQLGRAGLIYGPNDPSFSRVVFEKPFGHDLSSAKELNANIAAVLREDQTYRIDHYLGKETVRNILVFRLGNSIFEPLWNGAHVDHVQITVSESLGVEGRGAYFDEAGILRDMIQNHMLQLLSFVAMEPPASMDANAVRDEKVKVLRSIVRYSPRDAALNSVRGQYGPGWVEGGQVPGYREEGGVSRDSTTPTFAALKLAIANWRWAGTPFYLMAGKRLPKRATEIAVRFKQVPHRLFEAGGPHTDANVLVMRIQPDEGIALRVVSKVPGRGVRLQPVRMEFRYGATFGAEPPEAYERLLLDVMLGDSTLFNRRDEVEAAWEAIMPFLNGWDETQPPHFPNYEAGTWGPTDAEHLIRRDGRKWRRP